MVTRSPCAYQPWTFLPLELRRRLRAVYVSRPSVPLGRLTHLADRPRCGCIREAPTE